jgi:hypothetical protein
MTTIQEVGELFGLQAVGSGRDEAVSMTTDTSMSDKLVMMEGGTVLIQSKPVSYEGDKAVFDPSAMTPGVLYSFFIKGERLWVMKEMNGDIGFYCLGE